MYVLLSPAKRMNEGGVIPELPVSEPALLDDASTLATRAAALDEEALAGLMSLSAALATLNVERFGRWRPDPDHDASRQAARLFAGDTYLGLDAETLSAEDLTWAQDHVGILSGLYGVLRPLDRIAPYRLEMGTRLDTDRGADLYAFWGSRIAEVIRARVAGHEAEVVINCASKEYARAVDTQALGARVITPVFKEVKDGKRRVIGFFAKKARGAMARFVIQHRITRPEQILAFNVDGYAYVAERSTPDAPWFERPQPPPVR